MAVESDRAVPKECPEVSAGATENALFITVYFLLVFAALMDIFLMYLLHLSMTQAALLA